VLAEPLEKVVSDRLQLGFNPFPSLDVGESHRTLVDERPTGTLRFPNFEVDLQLARARIRQLLQTDQNSVVRQRFQVDEANFRNLS